VIYSLCFEQPERMLKMARHFMLGSTSKQWTDAQRRTS
jgi:hypothetical protein